MNFLCQPLVIDGFGGFISGTPNPCFIQHEVCVSVTLIIKNVRRADRTKRLRKTHHCLPVDRSDGTTRNQTGLDKHSSQQHEKTKYCTDVGI